LTFWALAGHHRLRHIFRYQFQTSRTFVRTLCLLPRVRTPGASRRSPQPTAYQLVPPLASRIPCSCLYAECCQADNRIIVWEYERLARFPQLAPSRSSPALPQARPNK
jgi:hypothetical protein